MGKEPLTTRLDADTKQEVENYAEDRDIGQTEAARRLIRSGLANEGYPVTATDGGSPLERLAGPKTVLLGAGLLLLATAALGGALATSFTLPLAAVGTVIAILGGLTLWTAVLAQIALARPLRALVSDVEERETA